MIRFLATALLGTATFAATSAHAAVTIGTQIVDTRLTGTINDSPAASEGSDAGSRAGTITAAAQVVTGVGSGTAVRGSSSVIATLTSPERGRVTFRRTLAPGTVSEGAAILSSSAGYRYFFTADAPTAFDVNWGVAAYGITSSGGAPSQGLSLGLRGAFDTLLRFDDLGDGASGSAQLLLDPGSYELRIDDTFAPVAPAGVRSGLSSQYSFALRTVPEPATWMLLLLGFGVVGVSQRRRRAALAN